MIIPSVIAKTEEEFQAIYNEYSFSPALHLDVMDGEFVEQESLTFPFELGETTQIIQAHLMHEDPKMWIDSYGENIDFFFVHVETLQDESLLQDLISRGKGVGLAIKPDTPVSDLEPYLHVVEKILFLSVQPGSYGAPFIPAVLDKIRVFGEKSHLPIQIDGHIDPETLLQAKSVGVVDFVVGSYLKNSENKKETLDVLEKISHE